MNGIRRRRAWAAEQSRRPRFVGGGRAATPGWRAMATRHRHFFTGFTFSRAVLRRHSSQTRGSRGNDGVLHSSRRHRQRRQHVSGKFAGAFRCCSRRSNIPLPCFASAVSNEADDCLEPRSCTCRAVALWSDLERARGAAAARRSLRSSRASFTRPSPSRTAYALANQGLRNGRLVRVAPNLS